MMGTSSKLLSSGAFQGLQGWYAGRPFFSLDSQQDLGTQLARATTQSTQSKQPD